MATPTSYPEWAINDEQDPITGAENKLEPTTEFKLSGLKRQEPLPRPFDNYWKNLVYLWIKDLDERVTALESV